MLAGSLRFPGRVGALWKDYTILLDLDVALRSHNRSLNLLQQKSPDFQGRPLKIKEQQVTFHVRFELELPPPHITEC